MEPPYFPERICYSADPFWVLALYLCIKRNMSHSKNGVSRTPKTGHIAQCFGEKKRWKIECMGYPV